VIQECERQTEGLMSCGISAQRTSQYPRLITPVVGSSKYDERNSDEATCRTSSISRAENSAVSACLVKYGVSCNVTSRGTVSDYHTETRRRYFIFGPRDLRQICKAAALAEPSAEYRVQCSVEIVARSNGRR
jgi:hypothetical protein